MKKITLFLMSLFFSVTMFAQITATWSIAEGATLESFTEATITFTGVEKATTTSMYPICFYKVAEDGTAAPVENYCTAGMLDRTATGASIKLWVDEDASCYEGKITSGNYRIILPAGTVKFNGSDLSTVDYVLNFTIKGGEVVVPGVDAAFTVDPANNSTVTEIKEIVLNFTDYQTITVAEPDLSTGSNIPVLSTYMPDYDMTMPAGYMMFKADSLSANGLRLYIDPAYMGGLTTVNVAGQYILEIPAGVVTFADGINKAITLNYTIAPAPVAATQCTTVAQVKALQGENIPVEFTSTDAVVTFALTDGIIIEDATGAMKAQSYNWRYETAVKPGMKLTSLNAYWNFNQTIDYGYYVQEENYPGVLYSPDTEELTYTLGEESTVTYQSVTPAALVADYEGYKYKAVKIAKTTINTDESGNYYVAAGESTLPLYYEGGALPGEAALVGYYGPHPYGESRGTVFNVVEAEIEYTTLTNANIITEYSADDYAEVKYVMIGEEKMRISYDGENKLPKLATTLKGYKASETYYEYDDNWNEIQMSREVFVVVEFTYETVTIADFVATTEKVGYSNYKCVTYNGEKVFLNAPYGVTIPGMGTVTGYFIEVGSSSGINTFFWVLTAEATGYSNINEYKTAVGAGKTAEKAAALAEPMLISYVYTEGENTTLFVSQKSGSSTYYSAIRTTATDKNGKAYAAGDSIKGVKGILTVFGYDQASDAIIAGNHLDVEAGNIEIISSGHTANIPAISSLYDLSYLVGSSKRSAGSYDAKYLTIAVGQIKAVGSDYYFFSDKGDSILLVTPGFTVPTAYLTERVGLKAYTDVKNSGDKVQLIIPDRNGFVPSNVKFESIADLVAAGAPASGITYELTKPVILTYIQHAVQTNWDTMEDVPQYYLYVQDATGAMRIQLDTAATRVCSLAVGDSIVGFKGIYNQYTGFGITGTEVTYSVKNSNNPLVPKVITIQEYLEAQTAGTYNGMLVRFEGVEFVERDTTVYGVTRKDRDFIQGDYKITYTRSNFEDNLGHFTFYPFNNITAIADKSWMTSTYGFMPISQDAIENAVSTEEGATIISIRNNTESKLVKFTGKATTTYKTSRGVIIQDGTGAILLDGVDSLALDRSITNIEGTYFPSSDECMARIVPTTLVNEGRGRLSKETVTIDSLVNFAANFEGEIVDIAVAKTYRVAEGVYYMMTTDSVKIDVVGDVVPADAKLTGLIYHVNADQANAFTVTAYDLYHTGSSRVLMFHELKDYMARWGQETSEQYSISGFTSPVLVNRAFSSEGGTALNVQQTNADGTITGLTVWAMETSETFAAGDSIYFCKGGYYPYRDLTSTYGKEGYAEGRALQAYRYDYHIGDIDYPTNVDSIKMDDGTMTLPSIVEVQLGTLIKKINSGNALNYTEIDNIDGFFGPGSVEYQAKNYQVTGTVIVDTIVSEWDGQVDVSYQNYLKVGEKQIRLVGAVNFAMFANQEVTVKGNFDIGYAVEDLPSFSVVDAKDILIDNAVVKNIAEFLDLAHPTAEVTIAGEVTVTYKNGANIYVQDETGSLLIFDYDYKETELKNGDRLTGVKGTYELYGNIPEMVDAVLPEAVAGEAVAPRLVTINEVKTSAQISEYVVLHNVEFTEALAFTSNNRNAKVMNPDSATIDVYNNFKLEATCDAKVKVSVIATVSDYKGTRQLNYISHEAYVAPVAPAAPVFTPDACEFANVISVALSCATENTEILYTIAYANNEEGGEEGGEDNNGDIAPFVLEGEVLYTAPFELSETATVTAYARLTNAFDYNGGYVESEVVTAIYTLNPEVGVENVELAALVYANNGMIYVETAEGNMVEVFTVQGQCIFAAEAAANVTAINALNSDVVLVRVNGNTVKVSVK